MITLGITGGVGAGKSTILDYLEEKYHAFVLKADEIGHLVMEPGQDCYGPVVELFGEEVIKKEDKTIDRRRVAELVFSNSGLLEKLNGIIHPAVKCHILEQLKKQQEKETAICVVEAALLLEDNYQEFCDEVWYIHTDKEVRISRLMESRGYSREKSESIIRSQASEEFFRANTDFEINNSGTEEETKKQIEERLKKYETL